MRRVRKKEDIEIMVERSGLKKIYFETLSERDYETELLKNSKYKSEVMNKC